MSQLLSPTFGLGTDGDLVISGNTTDAPVDSACTGTSGTKSLAATNASFAAGKLILVMQMYGTGAGNWELNRIESYSAGTIVPQIPLSFTYVGGAQVLQVKEYRSVQINTSMTLSSKDYDGAVGGVLAMMCSGKFNVDGFLASHGVTGVGSSPSNNNVTVGGGFRGGGGWRSTTQHAFCGDGTGGLRAQSVGPNGNGGGGGGLGGGDCGGGGGGNGGAGGTGATNGVTAGQGGNTDGAADSTTMVMGGGGGGGRTDDAEGGHGGSGGGIVMVFAKEFVMSGGINLYGGDGYSILQACGGGGAGGSCLIKAKKATIGTNLINVNGGAAGNTGGSQAGGGGGVGRIRVECMTLSGSTSPSASQLVGGNPWQGALGPAA